MQPNLNLFNILCEGHRSGVKNSRVKHGGGSTLSPVGMENILCWNVMGMNAPNKQKEVSLLCSKVYIGLVTLLETKVKAGRFIANRMILGWSYVSNHEHYCNCRVIIFWMLDYYHVH